jgi:hypothetical protein
MQKIRRAVVGAGFIGPVHVKALGRPRKARRELERSAALESSRT